MLTIDTLDLMFGSEGAIGVRFRLTKPSGPEEIITSSLFDSRYGHLGREETPDAESIMPNDSSAVCCTNYAVHIRSVLGALGHEVAVVGFANQDNPTSLCAIEEFHPGGHDFAIVDQRYLVDPWVRLVAGVEDQIVYDLSLNEDAEKAAKIYGPRSCWLPLPV